MTIELTNILTEKAKTKKDGVYSFRLNVWVVKDGNFVAFSDPYGNCYRRAGVFNVSIGKVNPYDRKNKLKELIKSKDLTN